MTRFGALYSTIDYKTNHSELGKVQSASKSYDTLLVAFIERVDSCNHSPLPDKQVILANQLKCRQLAVKNIKHRKYCTESHWAM